MRKILLLWISMVMVIIAVLVLAARLQSQDTGHCAPHTCRCLGMVQEVQTKKVEACWKKARLRSVPKAEELLPEEVAKCMENVPDHCEIIAKSPTYWGLKRKDERRCSEHCKPENCSCPDSACKSHEESDRY